MARDQRNYREIDKQRKHAERHQPITRQLCRFCGRVVHPGERLCKGRDVEGYECCADLTDPDNLITDVLG